MVMYLDTIKIKINEYKKLSKCINKYNNNKFVYAYIILFL